MRGWVVRIERLGNLGVICILPEITQTLHAYYPAALKIGFVLGDEKRVRYYLILILIIRELSAECGSLNYTPFFFES